MALHRAERKFLTPLQYRYRFLTLPMPDAFRSFLFPYFPPICPFLRFSLETSVLGVLPHTCFSTCHAASDCTITGRTAPRGTNPHSKAGCLWGLCGEGNVLGRLGGLTCWRCECEPGAMQKTLGLDSKHRGCEPWLWP